MIKKATSHVFTFPFWMIVSKSSLPNLTIVRFVNSSFRIYPPFHCGPANWAPMPAVLSNDIPYLKGRRPRQEMHPPMLVPVPRMRVEKDGKHAIGLYINESNDRDSDELIMNAIRVDRLHEENGLPEDSYMDFIEKFLECLRLESQQWWINRSVDRLIGWQRIECESDEFGTPQNGWYATGKGRSADGTEKIITAGVWDRALQNVASHMETPLYHSLLLDAHISLAHGEFRQTILSMAQACELAKEVTAERLWAIRNGTTYKRGKVMSGYELDQHIDIAFNKSFRVSFKESSPNDWINISNMWHARNSVAHGGEAFFRRVSGGVGVKMNVDEDVSKIMLKSSRRLVLWLEALG